MEDVYYTTRPKPKSDIILLKMDSGESWFANAPVNGTPFKFLMDSEASKSVISCSCQFQNCFDLSYAILG